MKTIMTIKFIGLAALTLALTSCIDAKPKTLGSSMVNFGSDGTSVGTQSSFKFNFALKGTTAGLITPIYLQGSANTKSGMTGTCNASGAGCICDFLTSTGAVVSTVTPSYNTSSNYFTCSFTDNGTSSLLGTVTQVRIHNIANTVTSSKLTVDTSSTLTLQKLIGTDLDINKVRTIYRYSCEFQYLQKNLTTDTYFDCTNQVAVSCDPNPATPFGFCLLKTRFPYYLYADGYMSNFNLKVADKLYDQGSTDKICGIQIKQYNCADGNGTGTDDKGTPAKKFGIFAEQTGVWDSILSLGSAPNLPTSTLGYAATYDTTNSSCPPGLTAQTMYKVTVVTADITPSHNFTSGSVSTELKLTSSAPPSDFNIVKYSQGNCTGTTCTLPNSFANNAKADQAYTAGTKICTIPVGML